MATFIKNISQKKVKVNLIVEWPNIKNIGNFLIFRKIF